MPPESLSKPLLPAAFVKKMRTDPMMAGFQSRSFTQEGHDRRLQLLYSPIGMLPDYFFLALETIAPDPAGDVRDKTLTSVRTKFTELQCAAIEGDPLWACEIIKLGCPIDLKSEGMTPLLLALHLGLDRHYSSDTQRSVTERTATVNRHLFIARALIEQHADLNVSVDGASPLLIACILARHGYWDLVSLLLQHGANPSRLPSSIPLRLKHLVEGPVFPSGAIKSRFLALVKSFSNSTRPARRCPCFSGQSLEDCHSSAKATPYPLGYVCFCGSGKTFRKCCARQGKCMEEKWSEKEQRIIAGYSAQEWNSLGKSVDSSTSKNTTGLEKEDSVLTVDDQASRSQAREKGKLGVYKWIARQMCAKGTLDPAFGYAAQRLTYSCVVTPSLRHRDLSRHSAGLLQKVWNMRIDEYIAAGTDPRSREEIERAAKIGIYFGALYRTCEGPKCTKLEGRDIVKLKTCSRCSIAPYCSKECQTAAWTLHKSECGSADQREQALPAQLIFGKRYEEVLTSFMSGPQQALDTLGPELFHLMLDGMFLDTPERREEVKACLKY
ncbi:hypothetical protein PLICRDRAFT_700778 [Plicaturopsis crispa FD-325 SS-3]|nr:hypothetical protein PLICRDRAFT_700778 [Plicaturopsis crispa FD-325 SS-3]